MSTIPLILILAAIVSLAVYPVFDARKMKKIMKERLIESWGKDPSTTYQSEDLESIASYFSNRRVQDSSGLAVDDITWRDLEMDAVFARLNGTCSTPGEETLYRLLREPSFDASELSARQRLIEYFHKHPSERIAIQMLLSRLGKWRRINVTECFFHASPGQIWRSRIYLLLAGIALASPLFLLVHAGLGALLIALSFMTNMIVYYKRRSEIGSALGAFAAILRLVRCARQLICRGPEDLGELKRKLESCYPKIRKLEKRGSYLYHARTYSLADIPVEYIKIILLEELIDYEYLRKIICEERDVLIKTYDVVGTIDALISIASFRESVPFFSEPFLNKCTPQSPPHLHFEDIYHPLIENPVTNSLAIDRPVLVTGSNASGKSTFLKTVAINAIFAQTIRTCLAKQYQSSLFAVFTSMAFKESMRDGESYFVAEVKSIKRMLDSLNTSTPCLCLIDEVLRGTNTVERIAASAEVLHYLAMQNCICLAATHDIELTFILESDYRNVHFQESIAHGQIFFDYKLREDRATSRNAIKLLSLMGYGHEIVEAAEKRAGEFMSQGKWMGAAR